MVPKYRRYQKLPKRGLQLRLTMKFVGLAAFGMLLEALVFQAMLAKVSGQLFTDGPALLAIANECLFQVLGITAAIFLPIVAVIGVLSTFKIAGPIYHFEKFLRQVAKGENPRDCKLRDGDELEELCTLLNDATRPIRAANGATNAALAPPESADGIEAPLPAAGASAPAHDATIERVTLAP